MVVTKIAWIVVPYGMVKVITSLLAATSKDITAARALAAGIVAVLVLVLTAVAVVIVSGRIMLAKPSSRSISINLYLKWPRLATTRTLGRIPNRA